jgi:hypothetical protein
MKVPRQPKFVWSPAVIPNAGGGISPSARIVGEAPLGLALVLLTGLGGLLRVRPSARPPSALATEFGRGVVEHAAEQGGSVFAPLAEKAGGSLLDVHAQHEPGSAFQRLTTRHRTAKISRVFSTDM